jgi:hypothetical protein
MICKCLEFFFKYHIIEITLINLKIEDCFLGFSAISIKYCAHPVYSHTVNFTPVYLKEITNQY